MPKNRQWSDPEHILYILFLELNREKIKSKLIRRYFPPHPDPTPSTRRCHSSSRPRPPSNVAATTKNTRRSTNIPTASSARKKKSSLLNSIPRFRAKFDRRLSRPVNYTATAVGRPRKPTPKGKKRQSPRNPCPARPKFKEHICNSWCRTKLANIYPWADPPWSGTTPTGCCPLGTLATWTPTSSTDRRPPSAHDLFLPCSSFYNE